MKKINLLYLFLVLFVMNVSTAQDGMPDEFFGLEGKVTTNFDNYDSSVSSLDFQSDGKIIAIGSVTDFASGYSQVGLVRYNQDGSIDAGFGTAGMVTSNFLGTVSGFSFNVQTDDKILVAGTTINPSMSFLVRYDIDGSLDTTFGVGGMATTNLSLTSSKLLQINGRITLAGTLNGSSLIFIRYNHDGILETAFGNNGIVEMLIDNLNPTNYVTMQPDGKIVVVWDSLLDDNNLQIMRFDIDGALDSAFGINGLVTTGVDLPANIFSSFLKVQDDGKILVVASTTSPSLLSTSCIVKRLLPNGDLDAEFGSRGAVLSEEFEGGRPIAVEVQSDGKIIVGGFYYTINPDYGPVAFNDLVLVRFMADGTLDPTFATYGIVKNPTGVDSFANALAIQADGKILAGGSIGGFPSHTNFAVWRYNSTVLSDENFERLNASFEVYPNPVKDIVNLEFTLNESQNLSIDLYDSLGRNIRTLLKNQEFQSGYNSQQLQLPEYLSRGIYFLNISDGKNSSAFKIIK